jgi:hypothetical protein
MPKLIAALILPLFLCSCLAGAVVGAAGAVVGAGVDGASAVVGAAIPDGDDKKDKD